MRRSTLLAAVLLTLTAVPALAQNFSEGFTFLKAVRERDGAEAQELVDAGNPAVLNYRDQSSGEGALHILVRDREIEWLRFLLARGLRPDIQTRDGTTPLSMAAQIGWLPGAEELLNRRANPNIGNSLGETPLIFAVRRHDVAMVRLLLSKRADPNQTDHSAGYSALDYARQDRRAAAVLRELEQAAARR